MRTARRLAALALVGSFGLVSCSQMAVLPGAGDDAGSAACAAGTFSTATGGTCLPHTPCGPGLYVATAGGPTADQVCAGCPAGTFSAGTNAVSCVAWATCAAGTAQTAAGTSTTQPLCSACSAGSACVGGTAPAVACAAGSWDHDADPATPCAPWTTCVAGERVAAAGSPTADRGCAACASGSFSAGTNAASCTSWTACTAGQYSSAAGSGTTDQACESCGSGTYSVVTNAVSCTAWTTCAAGTYVTNTPGATVDQSCAVCAAGTFSSGANQAICQPGGACAAGSVQTALATATTPTLCSACSAGTYCAGGTAPATACAAGTWDHDAAPATACAPQTTCAAGQYISSAGSPTANQTCATCPSGTDTSGPNQSACLPRLTIASASLSEGNTGTSTLLFTVTLSAPATQMTTVNYATSDGTAVTSNGAVGGSDYTAANGTVTLSPGDTSATFSVTLNADVTNEADETFGVTLSGAVNAILTTATATGTIANDDAPPSLSIDDVIVTEGNAGNVPAPFTVSLSTASGLPVTVLVATLDGPGGTGALAPGDYVALASTTLTFAPGETSKSLSVTVWSDTVAEPNEVFSVALSGPVGGSLLKAAGVCTIQNDDGPVQPSLSIDDPVTAEGNAGTRVLTFTVTLSFASTQTVTLNYATVSGTGSTGAVSTGSAASGGADFAAVSGALTFAAGETSKVLVVTIHGDVLDESDEQFTVALSAAANALLAKPSGTGTITNDDPPPTIALTNAPGISEGQAGVRPSTFSVTLSGASGKTVSVAYASADGSGTNGAISGGTATGGNDYVGSLGTITFLPGTTAQTVSVAVNGDTLNEGDETFFLNLSGAVNATLGTTTQATGTILNDDAAPLLVISNATVLEGNSGTTSLTFTVSLRDALNNPALSGRTVSVNYATADGVAGNNATVANADYVQSSGTLTFTPGQWTQFISVQVVGDVAAEGNESFSLSLSSPVNGSISSGGNAGVATGVIQNDDGTTLFVNINLATVLATEVNTGATSTATFTVTLSQPVPVGQTVTVQYATADGTAVAGADYVATSGTLTFLEGEQTKTVPVTVKGDDLNESNEEFTVVLSNPTGGASIQNVATTGRINDNDPLPNLAIDSQSVTEGAAGTTTTATFTVTLSAASGRVVTTGYATSNGTAQAGGVGAQGGADYVSTNGILTFAPGETSKSVSVTVNGDGTFEGVPTTSSENFGVGLSVPNNANISQGTGTCSITNDDAAPSLGISDVTAAEGSTPGGVTAFVFTVTQSGTSAQTVTVNYSTSVAGLTNPATQFGGAADFTASFGQLVFAPGETVKTLTVNINQDLTAEQNEQFVVNLSGVNNATIADGQGLGTITNDD